MSAAVFYWSGNDVHLEYKALGYGRKMSISLFFYLIMKKYFRKLLSTRNMFACLFFWLLMNEIPMNYHPGFLSECRFFLGFLVLGKKHALLEYSASSTWWYSRVMPQMCRACSDLSFSER